MKAAGARILLLASDASLYGADKMLLATTTALLAADADMVVVFPCTGPLVALVEEAGATAVVLPDFALRRRYLNFLSALPLAGRAVNALRWATREHRRQPFDLVITNTQAVVLGPLLRRLLGRPHVWHIHEIVVRPAWMAKLLANLAFIGADRVVCASESIRTWLLAKQPRVAERAVVVLNGVDIAPMAMLAPPALAGILRLGCIARLHPSKGQELLIKAVDIVRQHGVPVAVVLFGDVFPGNERVAQDLVKLVAELGLQSVVRFAGFEKRWELVYSAIDVCVVPSTSPEPFSLVAVESQACARAVIVPDEGGPTEIIVDGSTGLLFKARSAQSLADAIEFLASNRDLAGRMGLNGRSHVAAHFGVGRYQQEMVDVCGDLVSVALPAMTG